MDEAVDHGASEGVTAASADNATWETGVRTSNDGHLFLHCLGQLALLSRFGSAREERVLRCGTEMESEAERVEGEIEGIERQM